jgi:flagellar hook-associated protein 1 FlgK
VTEITALGGTEISITSGELAGLIEVRDVQIPELAGRFDLLADVLMDEINQLHRTGFGLDRTTDLDFFSGNSITDISVNPLLQTNPEKLGVAGVPDAEGDNQIALAIAQKRSDRLFTDGRETFEEFNNSTISIIGVQSQQAQREVENNELLVQQLTLFQESVSGVSIDEELSQMIQFQRAYEAAARYISTIDQLLETLVNI